MAQFVVKVKTSRGTVQELLIPAYNIEQAKKRAGKNGNRIISIKKKSDFGFSPPLSAGDRQTFFIRLSAMLESKVGTGYALALIRDTFKGKISEISGKLHSFVESGLSLEDGIAQIGAPDFPETTVALIKAGSKSGMTHKALQDAAAFELQMNEVKKSAGKGFFSAIFGFIFSAILNFASTLYMGPQILKNPMFANNKDISVGWIMTFGNVTGYIVAVMLFVGLLLLLLSSVGRKVMPVAADELIIKIPYYKDLILSRNNYTTLYGLSLLIKSGVRLEEALLLTTEGAPKGALKRDLGNALQAVRSGKPWAAAMETFHDTDKAALMASMDREQIAKTLDALARQYRDIYAQRISTFVPVLNLLAALFMSIAGGVMFGLTILPMLQAQQGLLNGMGG